jgi:clan AA aspartic protease (TIGR02281 family)
MRCPRCSQETKGSSHICSHCGASLKALRSSTRKSVPWYIYVPAGLLLFLCLILAYKLIVPPNPNPPSSYDAAATSSVPELEAPADSGEIPASPLVGLVIIRDNLGREVASLESLVLNRQWVALPIWACLAGNRWTFQSQETGEVPIQSGIWSQGMPMGLWKLETPHGSDEEPALAAWNRSAALDWRALDPGSSLTRVTPDALKHRGNTTSFSLPANFSPPGVFLQENRIVGWTFGQAWNKGFLWTGPENLRIQDTVQVRDIVGIVFAQSQESQFIQALSVEAQSSPSQQLKALAAGYQLFPLLADDDKPPHIHLKAVTLKLRTLCRQLQQSELSRDVIEIVDDQILRKTEDFELLKLVTQAWVKAHDFRRALQFFETLKDSFISQNSQSQGLLDTFHMLLYKQWIQSDLDQERFSRGWEAFEIGHRMFPDDTELLLLGAELAIAGGEWSRAEALLQERSYPAAFKDRATALEVILIERKSESGKITIRFPANSQEIPIDILLNKRVLQRFIIDTGADVVSIPSESVQKLGITLDENTPVHRISTASGYSLAYEVNLNLMEIKGYRVHNIQALVLDIPGAPGVGLLGQNFLKHFELEIDSKKGLLRLKRR